MSAHIYLDNNGTTSPDPAVVSAMIDCLRECWGNPSSIHYIGAMAKERVILARRQVANLLGATPPEIIFTSTATEANHMAIMGALKLKKEQGQEQNQHHIITSVVEHPSTLALLRHLESTGVQITRIRVNAHGQLDLAELDAAITPDTALVSLMWANNETGALFPIREAAELCRRNRVLFHTDAVQAVGRLAIDVATVPVDLLTLAGHKLHATKGASALYVRKGITLPPLFFGHQERGRRGGTENVAAIVGLGVAAGLAAQTLTQDAIRIASLRDRLERGLLRDFPDAQVNAAATPRLPNTCSIRLSDVDAEILLDRLNRAGICASSGSACTAGGNMPSHVLLAMGLSQQQALGSLRFSLSRYTLAAEIDHVLDIMSTLQPLLNFLILEESQP